MKRNDLIEFVEEYTDGKVVGHSCADGTVVFKMKTLFSLDKLMKAIKNEFGEVEFDFPVDESFIIVEMKDWK